MPARTCCLDLDTFFVSVERLLDPSLEGLPVVVGGRPGERGVVTAASYEVRALGVRSGMSMADAVRLAPNAIFLPTRHGVYSPYAKRVKEVLGRYTPVVQTASIDEFFLDFHGCEALWRRPEDASEDATIERVVNAMRAAVKAEIGLPCSAGIGTTRPIAKMASGVAKPAGTRFVPEGGELDFVADLHVRKYPGIGPVAGQRLADAGVNTLGELLALPVGPVLDRFGGLARAVREGIDPSRRTRLGRDRPAFQEHDVPGGTIGTLSNERTFRSDIGTRRADEQLLALVERVAWRARKRGVKARTLTVKLKYADFHVVSRSRTIPATHTESTLLRHARALMAEAWTRPLAVRLIGVGLSKLVQPDQQLWLPFAEPAANVGAAVDEVRARFGYDAIRLGRADAKPRPSGRAPDAPGARQHEQDPTSTRAGRRRALPR